MATGPTSRTLKHLRDNGFEPDVVEKWIPQARRRKDLYGFIDIVAYSHDPNDVRTYGVQSTTYSNVSAHIHKIRESPHLEMLLKRNWVILVYGWRKKKGRWVARILEVMHDKEEDCSSMFGNVVSPEISSSDVRSEPDTQAIGVQTKLFSVND